MVVYALESSDSIKGTSPSSKNFLELVVQRWNAFAYRASHITAKINQSFTTP